MADRSFRGGPDDLQWRPRPMQAPPAAPASAWRHAAGSAVRAVGRDAGAVMGVVGRRMLDGAYSAYTGGHRRRQRKAQVRDDLALWALGALAVGLFVAVQALGWLVVAPVAGGGYVAVSAARRAAAGRSEPKPRTGGGPVPVSTYTRAGRTVRGHGRSRPTT